MPSALSSYVSAVRPKGRFVAEVPGVNYNRLAVSGFCEPFSAQRQFLLLTWRGVGPVDGLVLCADTTRFTSATLGSNLGGLSFQQVVG